MASLVITQKKDTNVYTFGRNKESGAFTRKYYWNVDATEVVFIDRY